MSDAAPRVVVCEDDEMMRSLIMRTAREAGMEVVGWAESPGATVDMVRDAQADELILDLVLPAGRGEDVLALLAERKLSPRVTVFSAFASDPDLLRSLGADEVIHKPDFAELAETLSEHVRNRAAREVGPDGINRRRVPPEHGTVPLPHLVSPSGLAPPSEREHLLEAVEPGDAVMVIDVFGVVGMSRTWGHLVATDHRLHAARLAHQTLRDHDRLVATADGEILMLVTAAYPEGGKSVFDRIDQLWREADLLGELIAGWAIRSKDESATTTSERALAACARASEINRLVQG